ncbi:MAG: NAD(P)H-dependent oxidoreductase [Chlamydiota bacterium]
MVRFLLVCLLGIAPIAAQEKILAFAGSTRQDSYNKKLVEEAAVIARKKGALVTVIDLRDYPMPIYDADFEKTEGMPVNARRFRQLMVESDGFIIASPEYNHSVSGVLKNALDWASRDEKGAGSKEAFRGKKFALMSASPGKKGGAMGLVHLRDVIEDLGGQIVPVQVTVGRVHEMKEGFKDPALQKQLEEEISELLAQ